MRDARSLFASVRCASTTGVRALAVAVLPLTAIVVTPPAPARADQEATAAQPGVELVISAEEGNEFSPAIAYNSNHDEYLVVWADAWAALQARRVTADGQLLDRFVVSVSPCGMQQPSLAFDPVRDRYLVTWVYDYFCNGSDFDIQARFIPWDGPDPGLVDFSICDWSSQQSRPAVVHASAEDEFLVVWVSTSDGVPRYVSGRRVFAGGGFPAGGFLISSGPEERDFPDVAYNLARSEYLVTWDAVTGGGDIHGVRLAASGGALGTGEFAIAGWPSIERHPTVAACHMADQYLVTWESDQDSGGLDWAIYGRFLDGEGLPGNVYMIDDTTAPQEEVDLACDVAGQQYLLAWQTMYAHGFFGVWGRVAYPDETMEPNFGIVLPGASHHRLAPAVGGGRAGFLTAWEHEEGMLGYRDIHGRLVAPDLMFRDGLESGDTSAWSATVP